LLKIVSRSGWTRGKSRAGRAGERAKSRARPAPDWQDKVLHARLTAGDAVLMGSDAPPGRYEEPKGFSVSLQLKDAADAERIFARWPKMAPCACRWTRHSGRNASGSLRHPVDGQL